MGARAAVAGASGYAGGELLRSKSLDRNSYDSGDNFNRLDWTGQDNGFGHGLPPKPDNGDLWPQMKPLLADPALKLPPTSVPSTSQRFGMPWAASTMTGAVVTSRSSITRGFVSAR